MATSVNELPSYIEEKARADRQRHLRVRLLLLLGLLHLVYFLLPLLPFAGTRAVVPALALLPPLFATSYLLMLLRALPSPTAIQTPSSSLVSLLCEGARWRTVAPAEAGSVSLWSVILYGRMAIS